MSERTSRRSIKKLDRLLAKASTKML
jgi:hypothetical protein